MDWFHVSVVNCPTVNVHLWLLNHLKLFPSICFIGVKSTCSSLGLGSGTWTSMLKHQIATRELKYVQVLIHMHMIWYVFIVGTLVAESVPDPLESLFSHMFGTWYSRLLRFLYISSGDWQAHADRFLFVPSLLMNLLDTFYYGICNRLLCKRNYSFVLIFVMHSPQKVSRWTCPGPDSLVGQRYHPI